MGLSWLHEDCPCVYCTGTYEPPPDELEEAADDE